MDNRKIVKISAWFAVGCAVLALIIICFVVTQGTQNGGSGTGTEIEDCDAEDLRNREAECAHLLRPTPAKTTKGVAPAKPQPARTTRKK